jgi:AcrR family transcriptional regulator
MPGQRRYDSQLRRQQAAETRERIITAGSELVHEFPDWDWRGLTVTAVAARSGVNLRTVYRHFANERELRDAVMRRLEEEAGVTLESMHLEDFADITSRVIRYLASFSTQPTPVPDEPTFVDTDQRRRDALIAAVEPRTADWSAEDRRIAAALLDICWSLPAYERLVSAWNLDTEEVTRAISWFVHLLEEAVRTGRRPAAPDPSA